jgi:hypothetical protein
MPTFLKLRYQFRRFTVVQLMTIYAHWDSHDLSRAGSVDIVSRRFSSSERRDPIALINPIF